MSQTPIEADQCASGRFRSWAATHVGTTRRNNEDCYLNRPDLGLWVVADGAGGHQAGEVASQTVVAALATIPPGLAPAEMLAQVRLRLSEAHAALREEAARRGPSAMLATTVVVLLAGPEHFACLWAGDSRAYRLRDGVFEQITHDHSLVQELVDSGIISAAEAERHPHANVITRAVGADAETLDLDKVSDRLQLGDRFLLCSDGLCKTLAEASLAALLAGVGPMPPPTALVEEALRAGVTDNVTAVVLEILGT